MALLILWVSAFHSYHRCRLWADASCLDAVSKPRLTLTPCRGWSRAELELCVLLPSRGARRSKRSGGSRKGEEQAPSASSSCWLFSNFTPQDKQCFCPRFSDWWGGECSKVWLGDLGAELHLPAVHIPCCQHLIPNRPQGFSPDPGTRRVFILFSFCFSHPLSLPCCVRCTDLSLTQHRHRLSVAFRSGRWFCVCWFCSSPSLPRGSAGKWPEGKKPRVKGERWKEKLKKLETEEKNLEE